MPFWRGFPKTDKFLEKLPNVRKWLTDLRTKGSPCLGTLLCNLELELGNPPTPRVRARMEDFFQQLNSIILDYKDNKDLWYDPRELFKIIAKELPFCLEGPEIRTLPPTFGKSCCCTEEDFDPPAAEYQLCRVLSLESYWNNCVPLPQRNDIVAPEARLSMLKYEHCPSPNSVAQPPKDQGSRRPREISDGKYPKRCHVDATGSYEGKKRGPM